MSIEDRDWYKDDFDRRMGRGKYQKQEARREPQGTVQEQRAYNNTPPAEAILAARYELAIRARTKKAFWAGISIGAISASCATYLLINLPRIT